MDATICQSISDYAEISCDAEATSAVATPVMQIGVVLVIIIVLAIVGIFMKKNTNKIRSTVDLPLSNAVEKLEQDKILKQNS